MLLGERDPLREAWGSRERESLGLSGTQNPGLAQGAKGQSLAVVALLLGWTKLPLCLGFVCWPGSSIPSPSPLLATPGTKQPGFTSWIYV